MSVQLQMPTSESASDPAPRAQPTRQLYFGDNIDILHTIAEESIDLVYLDPPFNSQQTYNVLFKERDRRPSSAQIQAFEDTWHWSPEAQEQYSTLVTGPNVPGKVATAIESFHQVLGENDVMAYLVMMTPRLLQLHRVLKDTGSLYLHCDPTASHYLKVICDQIFGPRNFRNEVAWKRSHAHNSANRYGPNHDILLFYGKSQDSFWNPVYHSYDDSYLAKHYSHTDESGRRYKRENPTGAGIRRGLTGLPWRGIDPTPKGRHWAVEPEALERLDEQGDIYWPEKEGSWPYIKLYLDEMKGVPAQDIWVDIDPINMRAKERIGFPTQKPQALLERIIQASCPTDGLVLDPFCGCGTTVAAAEALNRSWIGIDIAYIAIAIVEERLMDAYPGIEYRIHGVPRDIEGAKALFLESHKNFEMWAVSKVGGRPNPKWGADEGTDGIIRFYEDGQTWGTVTISVKGGENINPGMVAQLIGTVQSDGTDMGLLITRTTPTRGMRELAVKQGSYVWPPTSQTFPKIQILSVEQILSGAKVDMPPIQIQGALFGSPKALVPTPPATQVTQKRKGRKSAEPAVDKSALKPTQKRKTRRKVEPAAAEVAAAGKPDVPAAQSASATA
jgi:DNA modification methylase